MRLALYGGFGEKGRTSIGIEAGGTRLLLDAGVKTSTQGSDYYPAIDDETLRATDAIILTHAHEDHVAALGWCIAHGFAGRIFITPESERELVACVSSYGESEHVELVRRARCDPLPIGPRVLELGPLRLSTGRSGHAVGGLWCLVENDDLRFCYCGDVVPASPLLVMDPLPQCDVIAIDASYGDDAVPAAQRAAEIARWVRAHPAGCVLPTPRLGRSAELLALPTTPVALAPGMRDALSQQIGDQIWFHGTTAQTLAAKLAAAIDWSEGAPLPQAALLCDDGMGLHGPSRDILGVASATNHATLFTGHLPAGSPGERMVAEGRAAWIRLPTHPTLTENVAIAMTSGAKMVLGHSCDSSVLARLARHIPLLRTDVATGDAIEL